MHIKKKEYETGLDKILYMNNDEKYIIELILLIVEEMPSYELVNLIFEKMKIIKFKNFTNDIIMQQILKRISNCTDILIDILNTNILDEYNNLEISNFFVDNIFSLEQKILYNKIEASLIGSQILDHKNILYDKQSESALINYKTICQKCKKCIYDKNDEENIDEAKNDCDYGVKMNNGLIYHLECFNKIQSN